MNLVNRGRSWGVFVFAIAAVLILSASVAYGQGSGAGTITGRALDPRGASVPDANVTIRNVETGSGRTSTTTSDGLFRFENLPPGVYDVTIEASAFTKAVAKGVKLQSGEARDVNFNLELAGQKESVVVTSEIPLVEASKTDVSTVITDKELSVLPATTGFSAGGFANDYEGLALAAPGVRYDLTGNSNELIGPGAVNDRGLLINVDGGNMIDQTVSVRDSLGASLEEVKEFQVLTNTYNAEYGQAGGVILNIITKSGTNAIHGDGHFYARGRNFGADFFYNQGGAGGSAAPGSNNCPLSDYNASGTQTSVAGCARPPFFKHEPGFTIGGPLWKDHTFLFGSWERVHQGFPLILTPPTGTVVASQPTSEVLWSIKLDQKLSNNHQFTVRFNAQRDITDNVLVQVPQFADPESLTSQVAHDHTLNLGLVSTPTPHTVNEARFFWHHFLSATPDKSALPGQSGPGFYQGAAFCCPQGGLQNRYQYIDNLSWTHGSHTVKTGANISRYPYFSLFKQYAFGLYNYSKSLSAGAPGSAANPATLFTTSFGPGAVTSVDNVYGAYVQDSWKATRNLTVNYGVRYDLENGAFQGGKLPVPGHLAQCFQGNGIIKACGSDHNNWQPRLGLAWSPNFEHGFMHTLFGAPGRSVVRASIAEVTELAYLNIVLDSLNFDGTTLLTATTSDPAILANAPNAPPASQLAPLNPFPLKSFGRIRPISPNIKNAETRHVSFSISRQLTNTFVAEVGYLGVFGFGLYGERDTNSPIFKEDPAHAGFFYFPVGPKTGDPTVSANGRPDNRFTGIRTNDNSRTSAYHGGYLKATQRLAHHIQFTASYTLSKTLGTSEDFYGASEPANPYTSMSLERAPSQQDIRHQGSFSLVVDTERMFHTAIVKQVANDWSFGILGSLQSGRPYPVSTGERFFASRSFVGIGNETPQRPNVLADGTLSTTNIGSSAGGNLAISQNGHAMCPACPQTTFLAPAGVSANNPVDSLTGEPVDFQFFSGNLARDAGLTSPYKRFDMSIIKAIPIAHRESWRLELKFDVFNVFNHPLFTGYNGNDTLDAFPISTNPACTSCLSAISGHFIGSGGQVLTIQDLRHGRVSSNLSKPLFNLVGDPAATDTGAGRRVLQVGIRFKF
jgi:carboxypeptidase family protein/TonB-dependent receptor-like protein